MLLSLNPSAPVLVPAFLKFLFPKEGIEEEEVFAADSRGDLTGRVDRLADTLMGLSEAVSESPADAYIHS